jgi:co-chaperonin GroES (HSP10)
MTGVGNYIALKFLGTSVGEVQQQVDELGLSIGDVVAFNEVSIAFSLTEDDVRFVFVKAEDIFGKFD